MYYLEMPASRAQQIPLNLYLSFNRDLDFCVWVLTIDGLQVPPFDQHGTGNGCLRKLGLTAAQWREWVSRVVCWNDPRLVWCDGTADLNVTSQIEWNDQSAVESFEATHDQYVQEQYQAAVTLLPDDLSLLQSGAALDLWNGSEAMRYQLNELWREYERQHQESSTMDLILQQDYHPLLAQLQGLQPKLPILDLYVVHYAAMVSYPISPVAGVISIPERTTQPEFEECVRAIAHQLGN